MGVNILVYKVKNENPNNMDRIPDSEWDWIRQGFDRDFKFQTPVDYLDDGDYLSPTILLRPRYIDSEIDMIRQTIPTHYQDRYIKLCELLKNNPDYWVHWSW